MPRVLQSPYSSPLRSHSPHAPLSRASTADSFQRQPSLGSPVSVSLLRPTLARLSSDKAARETRERVTRRETEYHREESTRRAVSLCRAHGDRIRDTLAKERLNPAAADFGRRLSRQRRLQSPERHGASREASVSTSTSAAAQRLPWWARDETLPHQAVTPFGTPRRSRGHSPLPIAARDLSGPATPRSTTPAPKVTVTQRLGCPGPSPSGSESGDACDASSTITDADVVAALREPSPDAAPKPPPPSRPAGGAQRYRPSGSPVRQTHTLAPTSKPLHVRAAQSPSPAFAGAHGHEAHGHEAHGPDAPLTSEGPDTLAEEPVVRTGSAGTDADSAAGAPSHSRSASCSPPAVDEEACSGTGEEACSEEEPDQSRGPSAPTLADAPLDGSIALSPLPQVEARLETELRAEDTETLPMYVNPQFSDDDDDDGDLEDGPSSFLHAAASGGEAQEPDLSDEPEQAAGGEATEPPPQTSELRRPFASALLGEPREVPSWVPRDDAEDEDGVGRDDSARSTRSSPAPIDSPRGGEGATRDVDSEVRGIWDEGFDGDEAALVPARNTPQGDLMLSPEQGAMRPMGGEAHGGPDDSSATSADRSPSVPVPGAGEEAAREESAESFGGGPSESDADVLATEPRPRLTSPGPQEGQQEAAVSALPAQLIDDGEDAGPSSDPYGMECPSHDDALPLAGNTTAPMDDEDSGPDVLVGRALAPRSSASTTEDAASSEPDAADQQTRALGRRLDQARLGLPEGPPPTRAARPGLSPALRRLRDLKARAAAAMSATETESEPERRWVSSPPRWATGMHADAPTADAPEHAQERPDTIEASDTVEAGGAGGSATTPEAQRLPATGTNDDPGPPTPPSHPAPAPHSAPVPCDGVERVVEQAQAVPQAGGESVERDVPPALQRLRELKQRAALAQARAHTPAAPAASSPVDASLSPTVLLAPRPSRFVPAAAYDSDATSCSAASSAAVLGTYRGTPGGALQVLARLRHVRERVHYGCGSDLSASATPCVSDDESLGHLTA